jgi:hypothetical protein
VRLTWHAATGSVNYRIYQGTTAGGEGSTPVASTANLNVTVKHLTSGTPYFFTVTSVNEAGVEGLPSLEVSATPN